MDEEGRGVTASTLLHARMVLEVARTPYTGRAERALGLSVEAVHRSPTPTPEKVLFAWAEGAQGGGSERRPRPAASAQGF